MQQGNNCLQGARNDNNEPTDHMQKRGNPEGSR